MLRVSRFYPRSRSTLEKTEKWKPRLPMKTAEQTAALPRVYFFNILWFSIRGCAVPRSRSGCNYLWFYLLCNHRLKIKFSWFILSLMWGKTLLPNLPLRGFLPHFPRWEASAPLVGVFRNFLLQKSTENWKKYEKFKFYLLITNKVASSNCLLIKYFSLLNISRL